MDPFAEALSVAEADIEIELRGISRVPWADFLLNPRRLRGSDFLMRWSQGVWSEERLEEAVNQSDSYYALPYGPSSTAPEGDVREFELYFQRLEQAGLGELKRPDLLIFRKSDQPWIEQRVEGLGGAPELPFTPEDELDDVLSRAILGVKCENSLWKCREMPDYGASLRPMRRLGGKLGLPKNAVAPTVIIKEEDREPLSKWQGDTGIPIHIWHVFYDLAFGLAFTKAQRLIETGEIDPTEQVYQAPGGATTRKVIYKVYYHHAYDLAAAQEDPELVPECIVDKNGHVLPYVRFRGGSMIISSEALQVLTELASASSEGANG